MKRILLATLASCLLAFAAAADIGPPGTVETKITGVSVDYALACDANDLGTESTARLRRWIELNAKGRADTLTPEEELEGQQLFDTGACFFLNSGIEGTVVLLDGNDYLVDYCIEGLDCIRVIQKSDGILEDL